MKSREIVTIAVLSLLTVFSLEIGAKATLIDNGNGTITDIDTELMWLQDGNYANTTGYDNALYGYDTLGGMTWDDALTWADNLTYAGYDDWRLPITFDQSCSGHDCTNSEMGHLYYLEDTSLSNPDPFYNLSSFSYWSSTEVASNANYAWSFWFFNGLQSDFHLKGYIAEHANVAWPVRVVPEPMSPILLVTGGTFLAVGRYVKRANERKCRKRR